MAAIVRDQAIEHIKQINIYDFEMPNFMVYQSPKGYPGKCVARFFKGIQLSNIVIIRKNASEMYRLFRDETKMAFFPRNQWAPENLVGVWM